MRRTLFLFALLYSLSAAAEPPLILSITWDVVSVPLGGGDDLRMDDAALQLRHDGRRYALRLATDIQFGDTPLGRWHLSGTSEVWGRFDFELDAAPLRGTISGQGNVDWRKGLQWQALLEAAGLQLEALLPGVGGTTSLTAHGRSGETGSASDAEISIDNLTTEFHGAEVSGRGRVNLGERVTADATLQAEGITYQALAVPRVDAELTLDTQRLTASLSAAQSSLADVAIGRWDATLEGNLGGQGRLPEVTLNASFERDGLGPLDGRLRFLDTDSSDWTRRAVEGELHARIGDFTILKEALPDIERLSGILTADVELGGTLHAPRVAGKVTLADGRIDVTEYGVSVTALNLRAEGREDSVQLTGSARSGTGHITLEGQAHLADAPRTEFSIKGENVLVLNIPEARVSATPDLDVAIVDQRATIRGRVDIPRAEIELIDTGTTLKPSDDVVFVDPQAAEEESEDAWTLDADVEVGLGDEIRLRSPQFQGRLTGRVRIKDRPDRPPRARGELRIVDASANAYGTELTIESGRLNYLDTPVDDPALDVVASRTIGSVSAGVRVGGHASAPEFELFSRPPMNDTDILSYLVLGRPASRVSGEEGAALLGVATRLAFKNGSVLTGSLQRQFGLDELTLESGANAEDARVVAGKYLAPRLYLNLGVSLFEPVRTVTLSYELTRRVTVEATAGTTTGADVIYDYERP